MNAKISVVVPVYKIEEVLLRRCLQSLCNQTCADAEFIIVDDGSPDNCGAICDEYSIKDSRMHTIHTENKGVSNARNVGIANSSAEYILFVDGDDFVEDDLCENCLNAMEESDVDILFFMHVTTRNPDLIVPETNKVIHLSHEEIEKIRISVIAQSDPFAGYWVGPPWGKVFRRSVIDKYNLEYVVGLRKSQDRVFVLDYLFKANTAALYSYCGYHYVSNEQSICHRYNKNIVSILEKAQEEFKLRVQQERAHTKDYQAALNTMNLIFLSEYLTLNYANKDNPEGLNNRVGALREVVKKEEYVNALRYGKMDNIGRKKRIMLYLLRFRLYKVALRIGELLNK